jgi:hypothetical protein
MARPKRTGKAKSSRRKKKPLHAQQAEERSEQIKEDIVPEVASEPVQVEETQDTTVQDGEDVSLAGKAVAEEKISSAGLVTQFIHGRGTGVRITRRLLLLLLLAVPVIAAYANSLSVPFYFDDSIAITLNPRIRLTEINWDAITGFGLKQRPVAFFSYALNYYFHQYDPAGYHIVNICVHLLAGFFLFFLVREAVSLAAPRKEKSSAAAIAFWATLIWLVNPLLTSAVTYVVQRMTSLAAMFYVLALLLYVKGRLAAGIRRWVCYGSTLLVWLLALGSKQIAIPLPFFIILYEWCFFQKFRTDWLTRNLKYVVLAMLAFIALAFIFLGSSPLDFYWSAYDRWDYTPGQRFLTEFRVLARYLSLLVFPYPDRLVFDYNYPLSSGLLDPPTTLLSMASVFALLAAAVYAARKQPLFSFAVFWFFGNLFLESVWPTSIIFEHKTYLPSMFFFVPLCGWAVQAVGWKRFSAAGLVVVTLFSFWTYQRNILWQDPVALWRDSVDKYPGKARSYSGLGDALFKQGRYEEAIPCFQEAIRLEPEYPDALNNLGACLHKQRKYGEAIACFQKALVYNPSYVDAHANLGLSYRASGEIDKAIFHFRRALMLDPYNEIANEQLQSAINYAAALKKREAEGRR